MIHIELVSPSIIQQRVKTLAAQLGKCEFVLPDEPMHDGSAHLEVNDAYNLVVTERGLELERRRTTDIDELLYWVIEGLASSMAWDYEVAHRRDGEDTRRQGFKKQIELLAALSPEWANRRKVAQSEILRHYPFRDG